MSSSTTDPVLVAVGIDVGSSYSRVAVASSTESTNSAAQARVISNTLGHFETRSITTLENEDQYIHGDAALRLLEKEKKPTPSIREMVDNDSVAACQAFFGHVASLASDATGAPLHHLRLVLAVPMDASPEYIEKLKQMTQAGMKLHIAEKKHRKHHLVVGIISEPAAVCIAHGVTEASSAIYQRIVVIDMGASGLKLSRLHTNGSTSRILSLHSYKVVEEISGPALVTLLAQHVASQFERKHKIPSGSVWDMKKARFKLQHASEEALQSLQNSTVTITIDGLFEGMDCHVVVSKPRWDMLTAPLLRKAKTCLEEYKDDNVDAVFVSGSASSFVEPTVKQIFPKTFRGSSNVPPHEAVALGCALHASACLQHAVVKLMTPTHDGVVTSPVEIGIGTDQEEVDIVISKGTPLPAHVVHTIAKCPSDTTVIWQVQPSMKRIANLEKLPMDAESVEVVVELSIAGKLSVAVQGGPITVI